MTNRVPSVAANLERMNEHSRELYHEECVKLVDMINKNVPAGT